MTPQGEREKFIPEAEAMYERLRSWRRTHPGASLDEIAKAVRREREALISELVSELAVQEKEKEQWQEEACPTCGKKARYKGKRKRQVVHREGMSQIERPYYQCPHCGEGFFPLG